MEWKRKYLRHGKLRHPTQYSVVQSVCRNRINKIQAEDIIYRFPHIIQVNISFENQKMYTIFCNDLHLLTSSFKLVTRRTAFVCDGHESWTPDRAVAGTIHEPKGNAPENINKIRHNYWLKSISKLANNFKGDKNMMKQLALWGAQLTELHLKLNNSNFH